MNASINVGNADRLIRVIAGIVLILAPFLTGFGLWQNAFAQWGAVVIGIVLVLTSIFRFCPLYRLIGVKTCRTA